MSLNKHTIKENLEKEKEILVSELKDIARFDEETGEWEAIPEEMITKEPDDNEMADRFEEFETRGSTMDVLVARLKNVEEALLKVDTNSFGVCEKCGNPIEEDRLEVNPAAKTCKAHLEE